MSVKSKRSGSRAPGLHRHQRHGGTDRQIHAPQQQVLQPYAGTEEEIDRAGGQDDIGAGGGIQVVLLFAPQQADCHYHREEKHVPVRSSLDAETDAGQLPHNLAFGHAPGDGGGPVVLAPEEAVRG